MKKTESENKISKQVDKIMPHDKWTFNGDVTNVFDDMLERSIPQYDVMRSACFELGKRFVFPNSTIIDLGCSRGEALSYFVKEFDRDNKYIGIEVSKPMIEAARQRFKGIKEVEIKEMDLRNDYPATSGACVTLSILTIMFTPIEYRLQILNDIYCQTDRNGCFIFVEKVLGNSPVINKKMVEIYHNMKKKNGYTSEQVERKRLSLEGVLVPITAHWNEDMLKTIGWKSVDCFWRWMNFAGWIAIK
jgi:tRNA (cmo5U34)-methyltransferase